MIEASLRKAGIKNIAGVDEAGRGACAGPLVVSAVILKNPVTKKLSEVADSKALTAAKRERLFDLIIAESVTYSIIVIAVDEVDQSGVHLANLAGMRRAVAALEIEPDYILTDGYHITGLNAPSLAIWKGDQVAKSISAASILAKVSRDRAMMKLSEQYPQYGLATNKGYITSSHSRLLTEYGPSVIHRKSFSNIASLLHNS